MTVECPKKLNVPESTYLEYKREITSKSLSREAVAFANHRGGKIMIGVDDDGTIVGVQGQTVEDVANIIRDGCVPPLNPRIEMMDYNGKQVITVVIKTDQYVPYSTKDGKYYIRVGSTVRVASVLELIDLLTTGSYKAIIALKSILPSLEAKISAGIIHNSNEALLRLSELSHLLDHDTDEKTNLQIITMIDRLLQIPCNDQKIISKMLSFLGIIAIGKTFSPYEDVPSESIHNAILEVMEKRIMFASSQKSDIMLTTLNILLVIGVACIWSNHLKQLSKVTSIMDIHCNYDKTITKRCNLLKEKLKKYRDEEPTFQPRRMGIFCENMLDHNTLKKFVNHPI